MKFNEVAAGAASAKRLQILSFSSRSGAAKRFLFLTSITFILVETVPNICRAQESDENRVVKQFIELDKRVQEFFSTDRMLVTKQKNPAGINVFSVEQFHIVVTQYDVRKTDSIISPFKGIIDANYIMTGNERCGVAKLVRGRFGDIFFGWPDVTPAIAAAMQRNCPGDVPAVQNKLELTYAYQGHKWVLTAAVDLDHGWVQRGISATLGLPGNPQTVFLPDEPEALTFNKPWQVIAGD